MEQRARVMGKIITLMFIAYIEKMKKITLKMKILKKDVSDLEKFADRILKYNIDVEFTTLFDRLNDPRNSPEIKSLELQRS